MMTPEELRQALAAPGMKSMILDTDTYNEIDDQFALAFAMRSSERVRLLAVTAAPFLNTRSSSPADGMEKSYQEIFRIARLTDPAFSFPVYRGATHYMTDPTLPVESPACDAIIDAVMASSETVYIVAIGAITNVASALVKCPAIAEKAVIVWLGGHADFMPDAREFNLFQDLIASKIIFDSRIPFVQVPCVGMATALTTTVEELSALIGGKNELCDYLVGIVAKEAGTRRPCSRVIWDVLAVSALVCPQHLAITVKGRPTLDETFHYVPVNDGRQFLYVYHLNRDAIFAELFAKLGKKAEA